MKPLIWLAALSLLAMSGCDHADDNAAVDASADQPTANLSDALNAEMEDSANTAVMIGSVQSFASGHGVDPDGSDGDTAKGPDDHRGTNP